MKCPICGTENKSTNKACFKCSHVLDDRGVQPKGNVNSLWYSTSERKTQQIPPPFWGDTKGKPTYEDKSDFIVLHDEASKSNAAQDLVDRGAPVPDNRQKLERLRGKREVQVVVPARPAPFVQSQQPRRRFKIKWPRMIVSSLIIIMLFVGVGYGAFMLYKLVAGAASQLTADKQGAAAVLDPKVENVMIDGEAWHKITFYGKDGDVVLVADPKRSLPIKNGKAELMLNDQGYIPEDLVEDKVIVSLEALIISPDGKNTKITINPYEIKVPLSPLKIVLPKEQEVTTNEDSILVKIKVTPGSNRVLIGETNVTDYVNKDGYVSTTVNLNPNGVNTILIVVETGKHRKNNYELKVTWPVMDVPIKLNDPPTKTVDSTVTIEGGTTPGSTIETNAIVSGSISQPKSDGTFHFKVKLKRWGWNDISITSKAADGSSSTMVHRINHMPTLGSYTKDAQVLDYAYLCSAAENMVGRIFKIEGTIEKKLESDISDYYLFNVGTMNEPKMLAVEYSKEEGLKPNQYYSIFADVTGVLDNYPVLTARFVYEKDMPAGYSTSPDTSPSASATASATPEPTSSGE